MKKIISTLIVACAIVGFTACGEPKPATETPVDSTATESMQADTTSTPMPATPDTSQH